MNTVDIECPLCHKRFEAPMGNPTIFKEARAEFEKHMAEKHDYYLRQGWGWVPNPKAVNKKR